MASNDVGQGGDASSSTLQGVVNCGDLYETLKLGMEKIDKTLHAEGRRAVNLASTITNVQISIADLNSSMQDVIGRLATIEDRLNKFQATV